MYFTLLLQLKMGLFFFSSLFDHLLLECRNATDFNVLVWYSVNLLSWFILTHPNSWDASQAVLQLLVESLGFFLCKIISPANRQLYFLFFNSDAFMLLLIKSSLRLVNCVYFFKELTLCFIDLLAFYSLFRLFLLQLLFP